MADWLREMEEEREREVQESEKKLNWWNRGYLRQQKGIRAKYLRQQERIRAKEKNLQYKKDYERNEKLVLELENEIQKYISEAKRKGNYELSLEKHKPGYVEPIIIKGGQKNHRDLTDRQVFLSFDKDSFVVYFEKLKYVPCVGVGGGDYYHLTERKYTILIDKVDREHIGTWVKFAATGQY